MDKARNKIWFQESTVVDCSIDVIYESLTDIGNHYNNLISVYPGMTTVKLIDQGKDYVTIKTNEGTMNRTNIKVDKSGEKILVEFDEEYITSKVTSTSHFVEKFEAKNNGTELNVEISNLVTKGFLGFFLRNFGGKNIGNGFLDSYKKTFDK